MQPFYDDESYYGTQMTQKQERAARLSSAAGINMSGNGGGRELGNGGGTSRGGGGRRGSTTHGGGGTTHTPPAPKSEYDQNSEAIKKYTEQYVKLQQERENALNSGDTQKAAQIEGQSRALQIEVAALKQRNDQLKKWEDEADGNTDDIVDPNSLKGLNEQLAELRKNQDLSTTHEQWQKWQNDIDGVQKKINDINGKSAKKDFSVLNSADISGFISDVQNQLSTADFGSTLYNNLTRQLQSANDFQSVLEVALSNNLDPAKFGDVKSLWSRILNGEDVDADIQSFIGKLNEALAGANLPTISLQTDENGDRGIQQQSADVRVLGKHYKDAANAVQTLSSAMSQMKDPAARILGTIGQAIANVALGLGEAIAKQGAAGNPWAWIAFAATATATMISTISSIHSATGYARGGIVRAANGASLADYGTTVPGNSMSGDLIPARINSGELILNRAQQGNLAAQLDSLSEQQPTGRPYVSGENIYIALNTYMKRRGMGELTAFKFR